MVAVETVCDAGWLLGSLGGCVSTPDLKLLLTGIFSMENLQVSTTEWATVRLGKSQLRSNEIFKIFKVAVIVLL